MADYAQFMSGIPERHRSAERRFKALRRHVDGALVATLQRVLPQPRPDLVRDEGASRRRNLQRSDDLADTTKCARKT